MGQGAGELDITYAAYRGGRICGMCQVVVDVKIYFEDALPLMVKAAVERDLRMRLKKIGRTRDEIEGVRFSGEFRRTEADVWVAIWSSAS